MEIRTRSKSRKKSAGMPRCGQAGSQSPKPANPDEKITVLNAPLIPGPARFLGAPPPLDASPAPPAVCRRLQRKALRQR